MKNLKKEVAKVMANNTNKLQCDNFPNVVIFETLLLNGFEHNMAKFLVDNYALCDSINRRRRNIQEQVPNLRDKSWYKRKNISMTFAKDLFNE
jgi:hypothetical protein